MKVIIIGLGEVGSYLSGILSQEKFDVVAIDINRKRLNLLEDLYDIQTVEGYGAAPNILKESGAQDTDIFLALSNNDEVNIVAALVARQMGAKYTISRVSNPVYMENIQQNEYKDFGIDLLISPENRTALTIAQSVEYPYFLKVDTLGDGKILINQFLVSSNSPFALKKIKDISIPRDLLIVGIIRKKYFLFPRGDSTIYPNDTLFIVGKKDTMKKVEHFLPIEQKEIKRIILLGASRISYYLSKHLLQKYKVVLIESSTEKLRKLGSLIQGIEIYNENIFKSNIINELCINENDYFIAATENDEINFLSSIMMKNKGLSMIACINHHAELQSTIEEAGINQVFSPRMVVSNDILSIIREKELISLKQTTNVSADFVEFVIFPDSSLIGKKLSELEFPYQILIVSILRDDEVFIPKGDFVLKQNDKAIALCLTENIDKTEKFFNPNAN